MFYSLNFFSSVVVLVTVTMNCSFVRFKKKISHLHSVNNAWDNRNIKSRIDVGFSVQRQNYAMRDVFKFLLILIIFIPVLLTNLTCIFLKVFIISFGISLRISKRLWSHIYFQLKFSMKRLTKRLGDALK